MPQVTATQPTSKLDPGSYTVTCTAVAELVMENSQYDNPDIYRFYFDVHDMVNDEGEQATTDAICSRKLTPTSKLWKFLTAFGLRPEIGKTFELEDCVGKTVMAVVEPNKAGTFNNVASLVPLPKGKANGAAAAGDVLTEAQTLAAWMDGIRSVGYTTKEIIDHCVANYHCKPNELTVEERDELAAQLQGA